MKMNDEIQAKFRDQLIKDVNDVLSKFIDKSFFDDESETATSISNIMVEVLIQNIACMVANLSAKEDLKKNIKKAQLLLEKVTLKIAQGQLKL